MKKTILITYFSFIISILYSQSVFSIYPSDVVITIDDFSEYEVIGHAKVINTSDEAIRFMWKKVVKKSPEQWDFAICDIYQCWTPTIDSSEVVLEPGDTSNLDLHVYPNNSPGKADVSVLISDVNNPSDSYELGITVNDAVSPISYFDPGNIRIYPNPTTEYFSVDGIDDLRQVVVVNLVGQIVKKFSASVNSRYKVSDLETGLYLIRLINKEDKIVKTIRLSKR
ncbi:T9SS type A sorting domain-containing protein [Membranihabitans marinus]|uniref:T9SS type A sorting domain-containing protein n=1 Tax=Membranihabitans marinus TaxID=1227546 RepID=UPI001F22BBE0|nr:T9SS type A sorting domain-containing protein [Membranihabitans marinus]